MALLCLFFRKSTEAQIKPLEVGDKFPDIEFDNVIRYAKNKLKISDFKGKLVILDFWSSTCGSCIAEMQEMGRLQKHFGNQIRILPIWSKSGRSASKEWYRLVDSVWNNNPYLYRVSKLPTIRDTTLNPYKRHLPGVSVKIWIDRNGIIRGITGADYVNEKEISKMLKGNIPNWRIFKKVNYDYSKPLLNNGGKYDTFLQNFYCVVTKHKDYVQTRNIKELDSLKGIRRNLAINVPIIDLYRECFEQIDTTVNIGKDIYIETRDSTRFYKMGRYEQEWWAESSYCFEKIAPINMPDSIYYETMKQELDALFKIKSSVENRKITRLVLRPLDTNLRIRSKEKDPSVSLDELIAVLNEFSGKNLVVADRLLMEEKNRIFFPVHFRYDEKSLNNINSALKPQGLKLQEVEQIVPVVVLKDNYSN